MTTTTSSPSKGRVPRGEPHRIYWQQWIANANSSDEPKLSRRELITSSAAVRMTNSAIVSDITKLIRTTMELTDENDSIVLVGTLHSVSDRLVQFDPRFVPTHTNDALPRTKPYHVVKTLRADDLPMMARDEMLSYLEGVLERAPPETSGAVIAPKLQFFYIPSPELEAMPVLIPNCVELDGYCTDTEDGESDQQNEPPPALESSEIVRSLNTTGNEFQPIETQFPWLVAPSDGTADTAVDRVRDYHETLANELHSIPKSHSGCVLQRDGVDVYVWRTVWCVLTADHLWTVSRIRKHGYPHIQRIRLARALLLQPSSDYPPLFKTPYAWEIVAEDGTTHLFRSSCRTDQQAWMAKISEAIVAAYEASLLRDAETLIVDNCIARGKRRTRVAVEPLVAAADGPMKDTILRFGLTVANYHESHRLQIATWKQAKSIVKRAVELVEQYSKERSHVKTLCRHLEFVMTGRQRSSGFLGETTASLENSTASSTHDGPPPKDLFDSILLELQQLAVSLG